jgi:hypothetical protein
MSLTVPDGSTVLKDPSDIAVYQVDWDALHLAAAVTIVTSTFAVTAVRPSTATVPTISVTSPLGIQSGSRKVKLSLTGGTAGALYRVTHTIVTSETPAQTKERSWWLKVENL